MDLWQAQCQIMLIILLKESIKLNANMFMINEKRETFGIAVNT